MENQTYRYELKNSLITETEKTYLTEIKKVLPQGYFVQPQVNLASIIYKTDKKFCYTDLYRNIDACVFDMTYKPIFLIEINDSTHEEYKVKQRDKKVKNICEEAGIPLMNLWTKYGINPEYITKKVMQSIEDSKNPVRVAHSAEKEQEAAKNTAQTNETETNDDGHCYIATAVYGSYDCDEVIILRKFRDEKLKKSLVGRTFIKIYYALSPMLVRKFGKRDTFKKFWRKKLDSFIQRYEFVNSTKNSK